jgi:hypothetical protein
MLLALRSGTVHSAAGEQPVHPVRQYLETPALQEYAQAALALAHMYYYEKNNVPQSFEHLNSIISDRNITSPSDRAYAKLLMSKVYYYERTDIPYRHGMILKLLSQVISDEQTPEHMRTKAITLWNEFLADTQTPYGVRVHAGELRYYVHVVLPDIECLPTRSVSCLSASGRALSFPCTATSMSLPTEAQLRPEKRHRQNDEIDKQKPRALKRPCS